MYSYFKPEKDSSKQAVVAAVAGQQQRDIVVNEEDPSVQAKGLLDLQNAGMGINFERTNELALECAEEILEHWLPDGEQRGVQYLAINPHRNDSELGSFTIKTSTGVWSDFSSGEKGGDLISLIKYVGQYEHQAQAAAKILELIAGQQVDAVVRKVRQEAKAKAIAADEFTVIMPIPSNAGNKPIFFGRELGTPSMTWEYRNESGQVMFYVNRFETIKGKTTRPLTYGKESSGHETWKPKAPPVPRSAYGLDRLAARPNAPVLFTEGEKTADAAQRLLPDFVAVTTMNGAQSPEKTDFSPFAGRKVYIAPDNDEAGAGYRDKLIGLLNSVGAEVVAVMKLEVFANGERFLEEGYDLADAETEGWTMERLLALGDGLWESIGGDDPIPPTPVPEPPKRKLGRPLTKDTSTSPKKKSLVEQANGFTQAEFDGKLAYFSNQVLGYGQGYWKALNQDLHLKKPILEMLGDEGSISKVNGIFELVKLNAAVPEEAFERNSPLICLNNGTLNPITGELLPHLAEHCLTNKLDIDFSNDAQCPAWLQTLDEIFAPDADKAEKIQLLQEFIGYCLIPDTRIHKFLWMVGSGGNGKSLIISIITALIGNENISYAQIEQLEERFIGSQLQGKLLNISSEMSSNATVADGYLKKITSGDSIMAERKGEHPFSFKPYVRFIGATNILPRLLDHSGGFFRRMMILRFNRQFLEAEQDINREEKLKAELPGILLWAVKGLQALLNRKVFIEPSTSKAEASQYRVHSDPVRQFANDQLRKTDDRANMSPSGYLYSEYKEWCIDYGYKPLANNSFSERLSDLGFSKDRDKNGRFWNVKYYKHSPNSIETLNGDSCAPIE